MIQRRQPQTFEGAESGWPAGVVFLRVQNVAQLHTSPSDGRAGLQPLSSLASRVSGGVRGMGQGFGAFQHLRCFALWSLEGNRYFSSVFTSGHPRDRGECLGGGGAGRPSESDGRGAGKLESSARRQLLGTHHPDSVFGEKGTG